MASTVAPPSQAESKAAQSTAVNDAEPSPNIDLGKSPNGLFQSPYLARADSAVSERTSLKSHTSIPVVGTLPLGSLKIHEAMDDAPRPQQSSLPDPEDADTSEMPPLEGDIDQQQLTTSAAANSPSGAESGDTFLLLNLPPSSTLGADAKAINTNPTFQGLRAIPPTGAHFIWVSAPQAMSRCGYWFLTTPTHQPQVRVKQWDAFNEVLVTPPSAFELRDLRANVSGMYAQLVPFGFDGVGSKGGAPQPQAVRDAEVEGARLWRRLTACVSEKVLARVTGKVDAGEWLVDTSDGAAGDDVVGFFQQQQQQQQQQQARKTATQALVGGTTGELHFLFAESDVDVHTAGKENTAAPDTSMDIIRLIDTPGTGMTEEDLLGELQFTFLTGLHLSNLACIEQWWHLLLQVVLRAHKLIILRPRLSRALLTTFHAQMIYNETYISSSLASEAQNEYGGPGDTCGATSLLDVLPGKKRKLREALTLFKQRMKEELLDVPGGQMTPEQIDVGKAFEEVKEWFWKFEWELKTDSGIVKRGINGGEADDFGYDDDDEYRPVIVDLDGDGKEVGLVSFN